MPHLYDPDSELFILNRINDSVQALTDAILFLRRKFLVPRRSWIFGKGLDAGKDLLKKILYSIIFFQPLNHYFIADKRLLYPFFKRCDIFSVFRKGFLNGVIDQL